MSDGTRTRGRRDHNPELYQLSYAHQATTSLAANGLSSGAVLALTFDDGPDPRGTPCVLGALARAKVRATFFVLGERLVEHPELLGEVLAGGHAVEVHGFGHLRHPDHTRAEVAADLDRALEALAAHGVAPAWWRVPWGYLAGFTAEVARERGLRLAGWDLDTHDWRGDGPEAMLRGLTLRRGGVVLAHDGIGAGARRESAAATAELVGPLVGAARAQGLEPGPLMLDWPVDVPAGNPEQRLWVVPPS